MEKKVLFILVLFCFCGLSVSAVIIGDLDENGVINSLDFTLLQRYLVGINTEIPVELADLNSDNTVNSTDYILMRRYLLGIIEEFPVKPIVEYYLIGDNSYNKIEVSEEIGGYDVILRILNGTVSSSGEVRVSQFVNGEEVMQSNTIKVTAGERFEAVYYEYEINSDTDNKNKIELYSIDDKVKLDIYSDGWGEIIARKFVDMGDEVEIDIYEPQPYYDPASYFIYAEKDNYYTKLYYCEKGEEIKVDLIEVDSMYSTTGVIIADAGYFADQVLDNCQVSVYQNNVLVTQFKTDKNGIYSCNLDKGKYRFEFEYSEPVRYSEVNVDGRYQDIYTVFEELAEKPNIYLYPEKEMKLDVELEFPSGGSIVKSEPIYKDGWNDIVVETDGLINGKHSFLFYESKNPDFSQYEYGWVVKYDELEKFFEENMKKYGFNNQEIADFIEYWIEERLSEDNEYYVIYPQTTEDIEKEIVLNFSQEPDSILRLIYTFVGRDNPDVNIKEPVIEPFEREGFTVVEWGGILK